MRMRKPGVPKHPFGSHADSLAWYLKVEGIPTPEFEYRFAERNWRFDLAWPQSKVAVEIDGGVFIGGRHVRGAGFKKDLEKLNQAIIQGWKVLRFTPDQIGLVETWKLIAQALESRGSRGW